MPSDPIMPDPADDPDNIPATERRNTAERPEVVWPYLWENQPYHLLLGQVTEIQWRGISIPVWCVTGGAGALPVFRGDFVRYEDLPESLLSQFLESQEVPVGPFYGTAYVEDLRLFLKQSQARNRAGRNQ
ncbi:MAG: hypothetical protein ACM3X0_03125 [Bacteroidota bacterium]